MNKKEMIEEMARLICPNSKVWSCKACNWGAEPNCVAYENAKTYYEKGYRKITEPIKLTTIGYGKENGCYYADIIATGQEFAQRVYFQASYFEREEIQAETAEEIYSKLIELSENPCNSQEEVYKAVFEEYGVKVVEE